MNIEQGQEVSYSTEAAYVWTFMKMNYNWVPTIFQPPIHVDWENFGPNNDKVNNKGLVYSRNAEFYAVWARDSNLRMISPFEYRVNVYHKTLLDGYMGNYDIVPNVNMARVICWHIFIHEYIHYIDVYWKYYDYLYAGDGDKYYKKLLKYIQVDSGKPKNEISTETRALEVLHDIIMYTCEVTPYPAIHDYMDPIFDGPYARKKPELNLALAQLEEYTLYNKTSYDADKLDHEDYMAMRYRLKEIGKRMKQLIKETDNRPAKWID